MAFDFLLSSEYYSMFLAWAFRVLRISIKFKVYEAFHSEVTESFLPQQIAIL